jgi:cyclase
MLTESLDAPQRLIGVVTVRNGWAVQSFNYKKYLPIGEPATLVRTLGRWGVDEILLNCIDLSAQSLGPDFELLETIAQAFVGVPLTYGGGIRDEHDANRAISAGADRIAIDSILRDEPETAASLAARIGFQAVVAVFPTTAPPKGLRPSLLDYRTGLSSDLFQEIFKLGSPFPFAEALVVDVDREGSCLGFQQTLLRPFQEAQIPTLALGGISTISQVANTLKEPGVQGVCIENSLFYRDFSSIQIANEVDGLRNLNPSSSWQFD